MRYLFVNRPIKINDEEIDPYIEIFGKMVRLAIRDYVVYKKRYQNGLKFKKFQTRQQKNWDRLRYADWKNARDLLQGTSVQRFADGLKPSQIKGDEHYIPGGE